MKFEGHPSIAQEKKESIQTPEIMPLQSITGPLSERLAMQLSPDQWRRFDNEVLIPHDLAPEDLEYVTDEAMARDIAGKTYEYFETIDEAVRENIAHEIPEDIRSQKAA